MARRVDVLKPILRRAGPALLIVALIAQLVCLALFLVPVMGAGDELTPGKTRHVSTLCWSGDVNRPMLVVIVSLAGGALGGALRGLASLTERVATRQFDPLWTMWYLANPFVGAAVAMVFLFALQAGLAGQGSANSAASLSGTAGIAALIGLFSRHALEKLREVFDVVVGQHRLAAPTQDGTAPEGPTIHALSPSTVPAADADTPLIIAGAGFTPGSVVEINGRRVDGTVRPDTISLIVPGHLVARAATLPVRVRSHGTWSNTADLDVRP